MKADTGIRICAGLLALFCAIGLARVIAVMGLQVPLDPNEGWNAYHTLHAMTGGVLYPGVDTFLINNYPPLSYYIVGIFALLTGDNIVAGRIVSLMSVFAVAWAIFTSARSMKADAESAIIAILVFIAGLLVFTDYVGMDDPQMLGHAIQLTGLVLLLRPKCLENTVFAALLMTAGVFIKHNLIALPLAVALWLFTKDRQRAYAFAMFGIAFGLMGIGLFRIVYGMPLWSVLASPRIYSFDQLMAGLHGWHIWLGLPLTAFAAFYLPRRDETFPLLCGTYAVVATIIAFAFAGGAGVDMNVWFDAAIALSLVTAFILSTAKGRWKPLLALGFTLPIVAGIGLNWDNSWLERDFWLRPMADEAATAHTDIAFLEAHDGPALCEMLSLCCWAGKPAEADVFNLGQAYATHARSDDALVGLLDARYYKSIEFDSLDEFALTPHVKQALLRDYRIDHQNDDGVFLVPR